MSSIAPTEPTATDSGTVHTEAREGDIDHSVADILKADSIVTSHLLFHCEKVSNERSSGGKCERSVWAISR